VKSLRFMIPLGISIVFIFESCSFLDKSIINPVNPQSSIIGLNMIVEAPIGLFSDIPDKIIFIRSDNLNDIKSGNLVESNCIKNDNIYLLNAPSGIYHIIGSYKSRMTVKYLTILNDEAIMASRFEVTPNTITYLGKYRIKANMDKLKDNELHDYFKDRIEYTDDHLYLNEPKNVTIFPGYLYHGYIISIDKGDNSNKIFIDQTKKILANSEWIKIIGVGK
jgi:hypothetical protein